MSNTLIHSAILSYTTSTTELEKKLTKGFYFIDENGSDWIRLVFAQLFPLNIGAPMSLPN